MREIFLGPKKDKGEDEQNHSGGFDSDVLTIDEVKVKKPRMYKVLLHNDDYTTMEFVTYVLQHFFQKSKAESTAIMLSVHTQGMGMCGIYSKEVAESKVAKVVKTAKNDGHPLRCTCEPE